MHGMAILFPFGVRASTWLCVLAFAALAARRRSVVPLMAAWVWLIGFEAAFDLFGFAFYGYATDRILPLVLGAFTIAWCLRTKTLRVSVPWAIATVIAWAVWLALGFHWNSYTDSSVNVEWEVLNELTKTLWAVAYLVPLVWLDRFDAELVGVDGGRRPRGAGRVVL